MMAENRYISPVNLACKLLLILLSLQPLVKVQGEVAENGTFFEGDIVPDYVSIAKAYGYDLANQLVTDGVMASPSDDERVLAAIEDDSRLWPASNGVVTIPIRFEPGDFTTYAESLARQYLTELADESRFLEFVNRTTETDYVNVINGNGCWSYVGRIGGAQNLSISYSGCFRTGTVQHEFLHALGFWHEQSRPDRDTYVEIIWDNITSGYSSNFAKQESRSLGAPYDYGSVMHYGPTAFGIDGDITIVALQDGAENMGQRDGLSNDDLLQLQLLYDYSGVTAYPSESPTSAPTSPTSAPTSPTSAPISPTVPPSTAAPVTNPTTPSGTASPVVGPTPLPTPQPVSTESPTTMAPTTRSPTKAPTEPVCSDEDVVVWSEEELTQVLDLAELQDCAGNCTSGDTDCVTVCMSAIYTVPCAACFGDYVSCLEDTCECHLSSSDLCESCDDESICESAFENCTYDVLQVTKDSNVTGDAENTGLSTKTIIIIAASAGGGIALIAAASLLFVALRHRRHRVRESDDFDFSGQAATRPGDPAPKVLINPMYDPKNGYQF